MTLKCLWLIVEVQDKRTRFCRPERSTHKSVIQSASQSVSLSVSRLVSAAIGQLVSHLVSHLIGHQSVTQSADQSFGQSAVPVGQPVSRSVSRSVGQLDSRSIGRSVKRPWLLASPLIADRTCLANACVEKQATFFKAYVVNGGRPFSKLCTRLSIRFEVQVSYHSRSDLCGAISFFSIAAAATALPFFLKGIREVVKMG